MQLKAGGTLSFSPADGVHDKQEPSKPKEKAVPRAFYAESPLKEKARIEGTPGGDSKERWA